MKKFISAVMVLLLCFAVCGCELNDKLTLPPMPTLKPTPEVQPEAEAVQPTAEMDSGRVIVNMGHSELEAFDPAEGTERILSFSYDTPDIYIDNAPDAAAAINEFIAILDETFYTGEDYGEGSGTGFNNMLTMAEDNFGVWYNTGYEMPLHELAADRSVSVMRCDSALVSLLYKDYYDLGGAHGSSIYRGYVFDVASGERVTLDMLSEDADAFSAFVTAQLLSGAAADADEAALAALLRDGSWCFTDEGMLIFSDLYELGSYADGISEFVIPYSALETYIREAYIPASSFGSGSLCVERAGSVSDGSIEIADMVKAADSGEHIFLIADGSVSNVKISRVEYSDGFYEIGELWACSNMTDCAVQLVTVIPDGMPDIMVSYRTADGVQRLYLTESGEDGSLILADDSIEAVG